MFTVGELLAVSVLFLNSRASRSHSGSKQETPAASSCGRSDKKVPTMLATREVLGVCFRVRIPMRRSCLAENARVLAGAYRSIAILRAS